MGSYLQLLILILIGLFLLWFGFTMYIRHHKKKNLDNGDPSIKSDKAETPPENATNSGGGASYGAAGSGAAPSDTPKPKPLYKGTASSDGLMICPICLFRMDNGEMIKSRAFPPMSGEKDRLMHIHGCVYCMDGKRERLCPVCGKTISVKDFLVARMFDRSHRRSHVHVLGCTQCRPLKTM
jgi:hypothetical protein